MTVPEKGENMAEYTDGFINVDGIKIHYYRTGAGEKKIVLLHGASDNGMCWKPVVDLLTEKYDVVMPDAQGHGLSDRLSPGFTSRNHVSQVVGLIQELGLNKPVVMGHSMGAGTTVNVAVDYPDLPKAIILEDPGWDDPKMSEGDAKERRNGMTRMFQKYTRSTIDELIARCRKDNPTWSEEEIRPWAESKKQFDPNLFSAIRRDTTYEELVPGIKCPALLITSDGGIVTDEVAENALKLSKAAQPLRWVKIEGAGHNIRREQFKTFTDTVIQFLDSLQD